MITSSIQLRFWRKRILRELFSLKAVINLIGRIIGISKASFEVFNIFKGEYITGFNVLPFLLYKCEKGDVAFKIHTIAFGCLLWVVTVKFNSTRK